jgi:hypothetical protein
MSGEFSKRFMLRGWLLAGLIGVGVMGFFGFASINSSQIYSSSRDKQPTIGELRQFVEKSDRYIDKLSELKEALLKAEDFRDKIEKARSSYEEKWLKQQLSYVLYRIHWLKWDCNSAGRDYNYLRRQIRSKYGL